jgi:hypothetical protein
LGKDGPYVAVDRVRNSPAHRVVVLGRLDVIIAHPPQRAAVRRERAEFRACFSQGVALQLRADALRPRAEVPLWSRSLELAKHHRLTSAESRTIVCVALARRAGGGESARATKAVSATAPSGSRL